MEWEEGTCKGLYPPLNVTLIYKHCVAKHLTQKQVVEYNQCLTITDLLIC